VGRSGHPLPVVDQLALAIAARDFPAPSPWQLPAVVAGRSLIADTVAQLPLVATRAGEVRRPQPAIVRQPDPREPVWATLHRVVMDQTRYGRAWLWITAVDADGVPAALRVLDPAEVAATLDELGDPTEVTWRGRRLQVGLDVVHLPLDLDTDPLGTSPLLESWPILEGIAQLYGYAAGTWSSWGMPSLKLKVPGRLNRTEADDLRSQFLETHAGRRVPAVLWGDADVDPIMAGDAVGAGLAAAHDQAVQEVGRLLRIPPALLNAVAGDSLTYSTTQGEFQAWLATGLGAYLMRIEAAWSTLTTRGTVVRFDTSELVRADMVARWAAYGTAVGGPWLTVPEVRAMARAAGDPVPTAAGDVAPARNETV
jgi:HK97 family phage portal protein